jgi:excisionase family DNA binding protein
MTSNTASARGPGIGLACIQGERLFTVEEVAEWLGVPVGTIYAWRYRSTGPASYKVGRHVRFRQVDIERWLEDQRTEPVQPSMLRQAGNRDSTS